MLGSAQTRQGFALDPLGSAQARQGFALDPLGSAQARQGFALDPPPFEKGGPKLSCS